MSKGDKTVLFFIIDRFNDDEFGKSKQVFEDNGYKIKTVSKQKDIVVGMFGLKIFPNYGLDKIDINYDALVIVGGMDILKFEDERLQSLIVDAYSTKKVIGAMSTAPAQLANAGIMEGKKATITELDKDRLKMADYENKMVSVDGRIITSSNEGAAVEFTVEMLKAMGVEIG